MKTRTAFPLLYALSFLMVAATSGSAQLSLHPDYMVVSLDSSFITYNMNQETIPQYTVRGSITSLVFAGTLTVKIKTGMQWVINTKIGGNAVQDGDVININLNQPLSVEVLIAPYAERPDTESYCLTLTDGTTTQAGQCITLAVTNAKSAVSTELPVPNVTLVPNPAGSYISMRGFSHEEAGYRYEIYSVSGAEVRHGMLSADARINVQDLNSGAYRLLLYDAKRTLSTTARHRGSSTFTVLC